MKRHTIKTALLALAGVALISHTAQAGPIYTTGDLLLGFTQSGAANDYELDLGSTTAFTKTASLTFNINVTDLSNAFGGASWSSNTGNVVSWGLIGLTPGSTTLNTYSFLSTVVSGTAGPNGSNGTTIVTDINAAGGQLHGQTTSPNDPRAVLDATGNSNSFTTESTKGGGWTRNLSIETVTGPTNTVLDLYSTTKGNGTAPTLLGSFSLDGAGVLTFTGVNVVASTPEPSTYALMGLGALALFWQVRRRNMLLGK